MGTISYWGPQSALGLEIQRFRYIFPNFRIDRFENWISTNRGAVLALASHAIDDTRSKTPYQESQWKSVQPDPWMAPTTHTGMDRGYGITHYRALSVGIVPILIIFALLAAYRYRRKRVTRPSCSDHNPKSYPWPVKRGLLVSSIIFVNLFAALLCMITLLGFRISFAAHVFMDQADEDWYLPPVRLSADQSDHRLEMGFEYGGLYVTGYWSYLNPPDMPIYLSHPPFFACNGFFQRFCTFSSSSNEGALTLHSQLISVGGWLPATVSLLALGTVFTRIVIRHYRRANTTDPLCRNCNYNLRGNQSGTCPECGAAIEHQSMIQT